jgi:xylulokinase
MPYLSVDIGSSAIKVGIISEKGALLGLARRASPLLHGAGGAHEADALLWVDATASACREVSARVGGAEIRAISVSGNGPTLVAVDAEGAPLGLALSWMDRRAVSEAAEVSALAGVPVDPGFYLPKALKIWRSSEELRDRLRWFFSCPEYLVFAMSGSAVTYLPHKGYEPYIWSSELLAGLGLPVERFPPFVAPGKVVGRLSVDMATRCGLAPGIPLVAGYPDFLASIVGSASVLPGMACDRGGTSEALNICAAAPFPGRELLSLPHAIDGLWNLSGGLSTAGKALEWFSLVAGYGAQNADLDESHALFAEAKRSPPGAKALIFLPYLAGERAPLWDADRRGAFLGLSLAHDRGDMARAACESIGYGLRLPVEIARQGGVALDLVRTSGASARNSFLDALKADILGIPVETTAIADCELVGDACASAIALGDAASVAEAALAMVRVEARFEPNPARSRRHEAVFEVYRAAVAALAPVDSGLARLRGQLESL